MNGPSKSDFAEPNLVLLDTESSLLIVWRLEHCVEISTWCLLYFLLPQVTPKCPRCDPSNESAILKPDIVFFGESLPEEFHKDIQMDKDECDLLIVIGSSLKVQPVALIPSQYLYINLVFC